MPGMMSAEDMQKLMDASGADFDRMWLQMMIAHHQGGVEMAEAVLARSDHPQVRALAEGMVQLQQKELDYMAELLAARS